MVTVKILADAKRQGGDEAVIRLLAQTGESWHAKTIGPQVQQDIAGISGKDSLLRKCIPLAAEWANFVQPSAQWRDDAVRYLYSGAPDVIPQYRSARHGAVNPIDYLDTWSKVLGTTGREPDVGCTAPELVLFQEDCFAHLKALDWRKERRGVGPWTFAAVFKIFLLHETQLWSDPGVDTVEMPTGGEQGTYSFQLGWDRLEDLGIVRPLPQSNTFSTGTARSAQAHSQVIRLAGRVGSRALHINSGIYLAGQA